jgi:hypothetical protein
MSEQAEHPADAAGASPEEAVAVESTGHVSVDAVLRSLDDLDDRPVEEHVTVFESAHETLRAALTDAGHRSGDPTAH